MSASEKLDRIYEGLKAKNQPGTAYQVAKLLNVAPSTVSRWERGLAQPQGRSAEALDLLYRTVCEAQRGNEDADQILVSILTATGAGLLGLGVGGILIAAGLGWILSSKDKE